MIFALADINLYTPIYNLPTAYKHYKTHIYLRSAVKDSYGTYCNLPTAAHPTLTEQTTLRQLRNP